MVQRLKTQLRDKDITGGTWMGQHNGFWMSMDERSLSQYLDENEFDAIILQNYWGQSDDIKSYSIAESTVSPSYYPELAEYIKEKQPNTQILINAIWSNEPGGQMSNYVKANYASNGFASPSEFMYDLIEKYNGQAAVDIGKTTLENGKTIGICGAPVKQIPVGYAVEYARKYLVDGEKIFETTHDQNIYNSWQEGTTHNFNDEVEPEGKIRLNRDGYHLSLAGRYLAGCVWVEALTGMDVRNSKYIPDEDTIKAGVIEGDNNTRETVNLKFNGLDNKTATLIQEIAHNAVEKFYMQDVRDLNSPSLLLN